MSTSAMSTATCPRCGAPRPASSEACPRCLLQLGLHLVPRDPEPSQAASRAAPAARPGPSREELAAAFPGLEIEEEIGRGGMGVVYRARQRKLDRLVALKILAPELSGDPAFAERFLREARALARLSHDHIVAVHDFGETDGLCWLMMEHVDGVDLRRAMDTGELTAQQALAIVPQICDALACAHELGIVHRDIKPENVLLDREGRAKIADFGLAKLVDPTGAATLTGVDQAMGTPHYMAPEQMRGARDVDHRADIYSLGVVFYEMLTGQLPVGRFDPPSKRVRVDVRLDDIVLHALETEPERRYQSVTEVKTDVERVGSTPPAAATTRGVAVPARGIWRFSAPRYVLPILAAVTLLAPRIASGMWTAGPGGIVTGSTLLLVLGWMVFHMLLRRDALAVQPPQGSRWLRFDNAMGAVLCGAVGIGLLYVAMLAAWERSTLHYDSGAPAAESDWDETGARAALGMLPGADPDVVRMRLATPLTIESSIESTEAEGHPASYATGGFLFLALGAMLLARTRRFTRRRTAVLACAFTPLAVMLPIGVGGTWSEVSPFSDWVRGYSGLSGLDELPAPAERAAESLTALLAEHGWRLVRRRREQWREEAALAPVATHVEVELQPRSPFQRWTLTPSGPRRLEPRLVVQLTSAEGGERSLVTWDAGLLELGAAERATWEAEITALLVRVRARLEEGRKADVPSIEDVDPTGTWDLVVEEGNASSPGWPGILHLQMDSDGGVSGTITTMAREERMVTDVEGRVLASTLTLSGTLWDQGDSFPFTLTAELAGAALSGELVARAPSGDRIFQVKGTLGPR